MCTYHVNVLGLKIPDTVTSVLRYRRMVAVSRAADALSVAALNIYFLESNTLSDIGKVGILGNNIGYYKFFGRNGFTCVSAGVVTDVLPTGNMVTTPTA